MAETEIMEKINQKKETLKQYRSTNTATAEQVKMLEDEIKELESSLTTPQDQPRKRRRTAFLDECAG